jgi:NAD(P)-dependent dehydrogenase (short-subunit alcohol dehydrogenase family)
MSLKDKLVLITGAAIRVGRALALSVAHSGANVIIHYGSSQAEAQALSDEIKGIGRQAFLIQADLAVPAELANLIHTATQYGPLYAVVNNAAVFESLTWQNTTLDDWNHHLMVNLTAPFLLSQAFARSVPANQSGRIVNLLDWRALRPGADHLPYTISKAALAALTRSLALALAPNITVNGLALGAVLPPRSGDPPANILKRVPAGRWAELDEVGQALLFLLDDPSFVTGEIIHIDGGRHLV